MQTYETLYRYVNLYDTIECNYVFIIKIILSHYQHSDDSNLIQALPE